MNNVGELCLKVEEMPQMSGRFHSWAAPCSVKWVKIVNLEEHKFPCYECEQST